MHSLSIEEQKTFNATEIKEVVSFTDKEVRLITRKDERITVIGDQMKINGFSKSSGAFSLIGTIRQIRYLGAKENLLKRLFK